MLTIARLCRCPLSIPFPSLSKVIGNKSGDFIRNGHLRSYVTPALWRQPLRNNLQVKTSLRGSGSVAVRLGSDAASNKGTKAVGYWLLTCSGMVFVAVVLGISAYYLVLISICTILREVIKRTVK